MDKSICHVSVSHSGLSPRILAPVSTRSMNICIHYHLLTSFLCLNFLSHVNYVRLEPDQKFYIVTRPFLLLTKM